LLARNEQKLAKFTLGIALARLGPILVFTESVSDVNGICDCFSQGRDSKRCRGTVCCWRFSGVGTVIIALSSQMLVF